MYLYIYVYIYIYIYVCIHISYMHIYIISFNTQYYSIYHLLTAINYNTYPDFLRLLDERADPAARPHETVVTAVPVDPPLTPDLLSQQTSGETGHPQQGASPQEGPPEEAVPAHGLRVPAKDHTGHEAGHTARLDITEAPAEPVRPHVHPGVWVRCTLRERSLW